MCWEYTAARLRRELSLRLREGAPLARRARRRRPRRPRRHAPRRRRPRLYAARAMTMSATRTRRRRRRRRHMIMKKEKGAGEIERRHRRRGDQRRHRRRRRRRQRRRHRGLGDSGGRWERVLGACGPRPTPYCCCCCCSPESAKRPIGTTRVVPLRDVLQTTGPRCSRERWTRTADNAWQSAPAPAPAAAKAVVEASLRPPAATPSCICGAR